MGRAPGPAGRVAELTKKKASESRREGVRGCVEWTTGGGAPDSFSHPWGKVVGEDGREGRARVPAQVDKGEFA